MMHSQVSAIARAPAVDLIAPTTADAQPQVKKLEHSFHKQEIEGETTIGSVTYPAEIVTHIRFAPEVDNTSSGATIPCEALKKQPDRADIITWVDRARATE